MKRAYSILLACGLIFILTFGYCEDIDLRKYTDDELNKLILRINAELSDRKIRAIEADEMTIDDYEFDYNDFHIKSLGHSVIEDDDGYPALLLEYEVTNNGNRTQTSGMILNVTSNRRALDINIVNRLSKNLGQIAPNETKNGSRVYSLEENDKLISVEIMFSGKNGLETLFETTIILD